MPLQLAATEAEYKQVTAAAERVIRLYEKQSVSENDYDKAVSGLQQITAKYNAHRNALADTRLTAPFDGYVQKIHYDAGETVAAGMPVVSLISSSAPEVEINIPASEFIRSDEFKTYRCSSEIYPDREFPLKLVSISRKANLNQALHRETPFPADRSRHAADSGYVGHGDHRAQERHDGSGENSAVGHVGARQHTGRVGLQPRRQHRGTP